MANDFNKIEEEVLEFWQKNKIFEKTLEKKAPKGDYVFYDGPPFATGLPHVGHILGSVIKDLVPRYKTMKGYHVRRRWGWDCHGLPIENLVEKELGFSSKKEIEEKIGIEKFNETCRSKVLMYTKEWKKMIDRIGRWIEFDNAYKTMDSTYMESVWWAVKTIWDKGLIYEGRKVLMYCPRCETPVSKAEVAMDDSYKDIEDFSTVFKFKVIGEKNTYLLAWSTTPWNKLVTVALAVHPDLDYVKVEENGEKYILAETRLDALRTRNFRILEKMKGSDLAGLKYAPSYDYMSEKTDKKRDYVIIADFVTAEEGTGIVTIAAYGEEDLGAMEKNNLPIVLHLDNKGRLKDFIKPWAGLYYKEVDPLVIDDLSKRGLIYFTKMEKHNYPFCWRCETQLIYNPLSAWFINIQKIKKRLIQLNEKINWYPEHLKHGRFLNILETAPDWNISRNRYWATPLPFWRCQNGNPKPNPPAGGQNPKPCNNVACVGSVEELRERAVNFNEVYSSDRVEEMDLHKHKMDRIKLRCEKCQGEMSRVPEVIDCWVESASMPFAEFHYPFENKKIFEKRFPGQYIAEYIAQTRAWFYYMHVMSTLLFNDISFENCVTTGTILNEKGEKLSKSKMNYTDPWVIIKQYGADALRYYLMTSIVMQADNLSFNDREVRDVYNKVINTLWNVFEFYQLYASQKNPPLIPPLSKGETGGFILDRWIIAKLNLLVKEVTEKMDQYDTVNAGRPIGDFINELSTWWLRRSRERFKSDNLEEKNQALYTLYFILHTLAKLLAPFTPFLAEKIYQEIVGSGLVPDRGGVSDASERRGTSPRPTVRHKQESILKPASVHLEQWPSFDKKLIDDDLIERMSTLRQIISLGLEQRAKASMPVRQVLGSAKVNLPLFQKTIFQSSEWVGLMMAELNVKKVEWMFDHDKDFSVELDLVITDELKKEGLGRELIRQINSLRKESKLTIHDQVDVILVVPSDLMRRVVEEQKGLIQKAVLAKSIFLQVNKSETKWQSEVKIDNEMVWIGLKR